MLRELSVRNLAIAESVELSFHHGLNVLTGETGAGKSIVVDAISLILGARGSQEFVRHGEQKAEITALFEISADHPVWETLTELGFDVDEHFDDTLLIKRDIFQTGKSTCRINGRLITLSMLRRVGATLVDIHGQHDHQSLFNEEEHINWLDAYAGDTLSTLKEQYKKRYEEYTSINKQIQQLSENERETAQRIDLLQFQLHEIRSANLVPDEEEELGHKYNKLANIEKLNHLLQEAYDRLENEDGALTRVGVAMNQLDKASEYDPHLKPIAQFVQNAYYQLDEAVRELGKAISESTYDPEELNAVQQRLHLIEQLKRKYASTVSEIIAYGERIEQELDKLVNRNSHIDALNERKVQLERELSDYAQRLTKIRKTSAIDLQHRIERELRELHMDAAVFQINLKSMPHFTENGRDYVRFVFTANPGEPVKPLAKIASGGELSRLMLALKTVFYGFDRVNTLVFDEIDTGVSGRTAQAIAEKMHCIAKKKQLICVSHLAQVACMADQHFLIEKNIDRESTVTQVSPLSHDERIQELARILGGVEVTDKTRQHAAEMLRLAQQRKH